MCQCNHSGGWYTIKGGFRARCECNPNPVPRHVRTVDSTNYQWVLSKVGNDQKAVDKVVAEYLRRDDGLGLAHVLIEHGYPVELPEEAKIPEKVAI